MTRAFVIGIVGAESSGKTQLAQALQARLAAEGLRAALIGETLREFCDERRRTPRRAEQASIAGEQTRRIEAAAAAHAVVVADTTALMTAVYSELVFGDDSLFAMAEQAHRRCDLTLLMALDLAWQADGLQRDGAHVRGPVDALIRASLQRMAQPFAVITGQGDARAQSAWRAVQQALRLPRA
jgi:nicotinamide riboside kinase